MTVWWSRAIVTLAVLALAALPIGALGTRFGVWDFRLGITILMGAAFLAAVVFLAGLVCWFIANGRGLGGDRGAISLGSAAERRHACRHGDAVFCCYLRATHPQHLNGCGRSAGLR